jgi:hypothetical protein
MKLHAAPPMSARVCVLPGHITGKDVVTFIPGLGFPPYRQNQLKTKNHQKADNAGSHSTTLPVS